MARELGFRRKELRRLAPENNKTLLGDWFANPLSLDYSSTLLFTNAQTLYSLLVEYNRRDLLDVGRLFRINLKFNLLTEGFEIERIERLLAEYQQVVLAQTDSRSVLGSMNDIASMYEYWVMDWAGRKHGNLVRIVRDINRTPQLKRGGRDSIELLREKMLG